MKYIRRYMHSVCSSFRWYRRRKGGIWYLIVDPFQGSMQGTMMYWTQNAEPDWQIIQQEEY